MVCFILGANPPWEIIEGFIRRIWTKFNIDKISFMPNGIFLVIFKTMEMKNKVLQSGYYMFDNKPLIVKEWVKDMEMKKDDVSSVPAWIRLHNFPLKFWGKGLPKIVKSDVATEERTRLGYARVMLEMEVDQKLPEKIEFKDEKGAVNQVAVEYEWKPIRCIKCKGMGHDKEQCKRGELKKQEGQIVKKVWRPVVSKLAVEPAARNTVVQSVQSPTSPVVREEGRFLTPTKRLVKMHREERSGDGYSSENFGAHSYKEILSSPSKKTVGGRIWVLWKPGMYRVHVIEYNAQYIHMKVHALVSRNVFYLTMVYAFNGINERAPLWDQLRKIASQISGPWAIAGDFNWSMFTWNNKQKLEERIYSRLDRFLVNRAWCDSFPDMYAQFLPEGMMDHTPCIVKSNKVVQGLKRLNREGFSDIEKNTGILEKQVEEMQVQLGADPSDLNLIGQEFGASLKLKEMQCARDSFLLQKAKSEWIKEGDTNTSYFHSIIKKRRNRNKIFVIEDMNGKACDTSDQVQLAFLKFYEHLLGTSQATKPVHKRVIDQGKRCTRDYHAQLLRPVTGRKSKKLCLASLTSRSLALMDTLVASSEMRGEK
ncbi:uncharacterized protein LOC141601719 [Silene latifolia]|uniref:uncharacterized protein LOC141601719 n=1 Tax=Silene latifolia TaxID=37657 RepID=UPI003D770CED